MIKYATYDEEYIYFIHVNEGRVDVERDIQKRRNIYELLSTIHEKEVFLTLTNNPFYSYIYCWFLDLYEERTFTYKVVKSIFSKHTSNTNLPVSVSMLSRNNVKFSMLWCNLCVYAWIKKRRIHMKVEEFYKIII